MRMSLGKDGLVKEKEELRAVRSIRLRIEMGYNIVLNPRYKYCTNTHLIFF